MLADKLPTSVGGVGCRHCRFWKELQDKELKESMSLNGSWGQCTNTTVCKYAYEHRNHEKIGKEKELTYTKLVMGSAIYFTAHSFKCPHISIKKEDR